jgi:hypothetical protein
MLRSAATRDAVALPEASPAAPPPSLLEELRNSSAVNPPPREGLLALLAQPAIWDLPLAQPAAQGPAPLMGRPIAPPAPGGNSLLNLPPGGFAAPPAMPGAAAPVDPPRAPPAAALWPMVPQPAPGPAPAPAGSLAEMFRIVSAAPPPVAEPPKPTDSLKDILRGLRPDRRD